jgi:hypothetical protein
VNTQKQQVDGETPCARCNKPIGEHHDVHPYEVKGAAVGNAKCADLYYHHGPSAPAGRMRFTIAPGGPSPVITRAQDLQHLA